MEEEDPATTSLLTKAVGQVNKIPFPYLAMGQTQRFINENFTIVKDHNSFLEF